MDKSVWSKFYMPGVQADIACEDITMPDILARTASKYPQREAIIYLGKRITFSELDFLADRFARALLSLGLKQGEKVALLLPNIPQTVISYYGIWRAQGVPVPNNPLYTDRELEYQFNNSGSSMVICLDLFASRIMALRNKTGIKKIISCHINDYLPFPVKQLFPIVKRSMYRKYVRENDHLQFMDLIRTAPEDLSTKPCSLDELALIPYTGGTTGISKGVSLTHRNISYTAQILRTCFFDLKDSHEGEIAIFPYFHLAGFQLVMNFSIINGWTQVLVPRPEPRSVFDIMMKYKPSIILAVPTIYSGLLSLKEFEKADLSFVKGFFSGAAPLAIETITKLKDATGADIVEGLGMTESSGIFSMTPWRGTLKPGSVGIPLPNTGVRIVDLETGEKDVPTGEEGEILFKGPQMCSGYYNMPEETKNSIRNGWFHTGDIGKFDEDGFIYVVDRKKDMIIAGGYNIYPREIDEVLYEHPDVLEACTIGVFHEYRGETVKAFLVLKPGKTVTHEEIDAYCRRKLAAYKVPRIYEFVESLPKSSIGKILKRELREMEKLKKQESS